MGFTFAITLVMTNSLILSSISLLIVSLSSCFLTSRFETEFSKKFFLVKDLIPVVSTLDSKVWTRDASKKYFVDKREKYYDKYNSNESFTNPIIQLKSFHYRSRRFSYHSSIYCTTSIP